MSDLISRSELIKAMNESKKQPTSDENIEGYCEGWNDLAAIINEQPTAYNVDNVVAELEECSDKYKSSSCEYEQGKAFSYKNAIDIVKRGGIDG